MSTSICAFRTKQENSWSYDIHSITSPLKSVLSPLSIVILGGGGYSVTESPVKSLKVPSRGGGHSSRMG